MGVAVDGTTMVVNDAFISEGPTEFQTLQANYEAVHGTGSYLAFLKAVDELDRITDNLDLARQYGDDKATAKRYEQFKSKLQEILSNYGDQDIL